MEDGGKSVNKNIHGSCCEVSVHSTKNRSGMGGCEKPKTLQALRPVKYQRLCSSFLLDACRMCHGE